MVSAATPASRSAVCTSATGMTYCARWAHRSPVSPKASTSRLASGAIASRAAVAASAVSANACQRKRRKAGHPSLDGRPPDLASIIWSVVESDFVHQVGRRLLVLGDFGYRHRIGIELAVAGDGRIDRNAGPYRVFVVEIGVHVLRLLARQPFDQLHRVVAVGRVFGEH